MLKSTVPTPTKLWPVATGTAAAASIANTSRAGGAVGRGAAGTGAAAAIGSASRWGRVSFTALFQLRPFTSRHCPDGASNFTMIPVSGAWSPLKLVLGPGTPPGMLAPPTVQGPAAPKPSQTYPSKIDVVRLPEWKIAA